MAEIKDVAWNGFNVVSTFSGCGGSCLGYRMAGFRVLWANEFVPAAQDVYRLNHPASILDTRDIRNVQAIDILQATGLEVGEIDLFDGSPPCDAFSTAGKREKSWNKTKKYCDTKQRTDDLFFEYARLVEGLQPRVFVAENVSGLVKGKAKGYFKLILRRLKECGYVVEARLLDAQWLGVPQMRQRLIFVGVRNDLGARPAFPEPLPYRYSVKEALPWMTGSMVTATNERHTLAGRRPDEPVDGNPAPTVMAGVPAFSIIGIESANGFNGHAFQSTDKPAGAMPESRPLKVRAYLDKRGAFGNEGDITEQPAPTVLSGSVGTHWIAEPESHLLKARVSTTGRNDDDVTPGDPSPSIMAGGIGGGNTSQYYVEHDESGQWSKGDITDSPAPTVRQGRAGMQHTCTATEKRKFSIAELKRICAFPDDFKLTGSYAQQWARLGFAVPPVMMKAVAETIRDEILRKID